jgi:hypothetical protein
MNTRTDTSDGPRVRAVPVGTHIGCAWVTIVTHQVPVALNNTRKHCHVVGLGEVGARDESTRKDSCQRGK